MRIRHSPGCAPSPCRFSEEAELDDAVHTALLTMREGFEGEMTEKNIEVILHSIVHMQGDY